MSQTELSPRPARRILAGLSPVTDRFESRVDERRAATGAEADGNASPATFGALDLSRRRLEKAISGVAVRLGRVAWLATSDGGRAAIWRTVSHLVVLAVILSASGLAAFSQPDRAAASRSDGGNSAAPSDNVVFSVLLAQTQQQVEEEEIINLTGQGGPIVVDQAFVTPLANPYTTIPNRERRGIIRYTVQAGDTLFGIAAMYGLTPETLLWANYDELQDNPHLLKPGMELNIPPVNGIVYVVQAGDTVESIAEAYKATPDAIYIDGYEWNQLKPGQQPPTGATLIIPGGSREFKAWALSAAENAPQTSDGAVVARGSVGFCKDITGGLTGTGTFVWPTVKHWVSGNNYAPWHPGLDLAAQMGDPIMASDNGVVVYAGWNNWGYGNLVVIDHGNGWQTWYAHNSAIYVECGQNVFQGSTIAAAGSTGRSTGPHLHFETRFNGTLPNPFNVLPPP